VRNVLSRAATTAIWRNPVFRAFYARLIIRGRPKRPLSSLSCESCSPFSALSYGMTRGGHEAFDC
jgi:hypothetical protein